jgi:hypothetical protein
MGQKRQRTPSTWIQGDMRRLLIYVVCCALSALVSCAPTKETVQETKNGAFKILVRSREFHHSSIDNIDVCVADAANTKFPTDTRLQCLLSGYDFWAICQMELRS